MSVTLGQMFTHRDSEAWFDFVAEMQSKGFDGYEIYTKNPETGETGWDIKLVLSTRERLEDYPDFDCIICTAAWSECTEIF